MVVALHTWLIIKLLTEQQANSVNQFDRSVWTSNNSFSATGIHWYIMIISVDLMEELVLAGGKWNTWIYEKAVECRLSTTKNIQFSDIDKYNLQHFILIIFFTCTPTFDDCSCSQLNDYWTHKNVYKTVPFPSNKKTLYYHLSQKNNK